MGVFSVVVVVTQTLTAPVPGAVELGAATDRHIVLDGVQILVKYFQLHGTTLWRAAER